jgi:filamentous hemagglutinin
MFGLTPVWVAAQITPNPNAGAQQPTVATTPSGIPLVQITRPSAAGVSNNQYDQFSVGRAGAVLNNSPTSVQSQLAGWITYAVAGQGCRLRYWQVLRLLSTRSRELHRSGTQVSRGRAVALT